VSDDNYALDKLSDEIRMTLKQVKSALAKCQNVGNGRPYEYEHNHFMLVEAVAQYLILLDEYNGMATDTLTLPC